MSHGVLSMLFSDGYAPFLKNPQEERPAPGACPERPECGRKDE